MSDLLRSHAQQIWQAAVAAARPEPLVRGALAGLAEPLRSAPRILVLGGGKAGAAMAEDLNAFLAQGERPITAATLAAYLRKLYHDDYTREKLPVPDDSRWA